MSNPALRHASLPLTFRPKKTKFIGLLLISTVFVAVGIWLGLQGKNMGWLCAAFFGLGIPVSIVQMLPGASYLTVDADGFEFCAMFRRTRLAWSDVSDFGTYTLRQSGMPAGTFVGFNFTPGSPSASAMTAVSQTLAGFDGGLPDTYGLSAEDLAALLSSCRDASLQARAGSTEHRSAPL